MGVKSRICESGGHVRTMNETKLSQGLNGVLYKLEITTLLLLHIVPKLMTPCKAAEAVYKLG